MVIKRHLKTKNSKLKVKWLFNGEDFRFFILFALFDFEEDLVRVYAAFKLSLLSQQEAHSKEA